MTGNKHLSFPPFLKGVTVSKKDQDKYTNHMSNWHKCRRYINTRKLTVNLMEQMIYTEMLHRNPREGMLANLLQKYNSARRNQVEEQLERFMDDPSIEHIEKHSTKHKRQEKENQENFDPGLQI